MALETAIRNPERYFSILAELIKYEGVILDESNLLTIVTDLYKKELVGSGDVDLSLSDDEIRQRVIEVNSSRNGDGGFPKGVGARFWTYMRTPSEFGLVYARYNKPLKISDTVKQVISSKLAEQEAFAIQAFRGNRRSPYRNVKNDYNFYKFIFKLLKRRQEDGHSLSMEQFVLATFSKNGDIDDCIREIESQKFTGPDEVFAYLQKHIGITTKVQTVTRDYPDVVVRMLVIMGMISIKYTGIKLIQLNQNKIDFFNSLLEATPAISDSAKDDALIFFNALNTEDTNLFSIVEISRKEDIIEGSEYTAQLTGLIEQYSLNLEDIANELQLLSRNQGSLFKEISAPLRLEFFTAMLIAAVYGNKFQIRPNYKADHEGKPYSHAPGGGGDIDIFSSDTYWLVEVTLIQNRQQQQQNSETTTVFRHMTANTELNDRSHKYLTFIAPRVHDDTQEFFEHATVKNRSRSIMFGSYSIPQFVGVTRAGQNLTDMEEQTRAIVDKFKAALDL